MKPVFKSLIVATALTFAGASQAALINMGGSTIDVGDVDEKLGQTSSLAPCGPGGSPEAEDCWAEGVIPGADTLTVLDSPGPVTYFATNAANTYAFMLTGNPEYFIIKNATDWVLYHNVSNLGWGVFSTVGLEGDPSLHLKPDAAFQLR